VAGAAVPVYRAGPYLAVPADADVERASGIPVPGDEAIGFDPRVERVVLRVRTNDGRTFVVDAAEGKVDTYAVADVFAGLPDVAAAPPAIDAPDLADWSRRTGAEPWLADAAVACAASPSSVDRLAGVGLLARLWVEPERVGVATTPRDLVRTWARSLPPDRLADAESGAVRRAWALAERIAGVADLAPDLADAEVAWIVRERDDLASVRRVLRIAGAGARLAAVLGDVDRVAGEQMSALADRLPRLSDDPDADRWHAVAWQEPDAWWSGA
jgi:hypothetical protein